VAIEIGTGASATREDARARMHEIVRDKVLAQMREDHDGALKRDAVRYDPPPRKPDGTLADNADEHLRHMSPYDRFKIMTREIERERAVSRRRARDPLPRDT
jgi:hypothetical protein